jgi:hypothetical protein
MLERPEVKDGRQLKGSICRPQQLAEKLCGTSVPRAEASQTLVARLVDVRMLPETALKLSSFLSLSTS